jgi:2-polyprenyl-3-methyl-5-hydroxy-6-metoxy-1,4-benzoquinol methylase
MIERRYSSATLGPAHDYLLPAVMAVLQDLRPRQIFELGCGNGSVAAKMADLAPVTAIDTSETGIAVARDHHPGPRFEVGSAYDDLASRFGRFPVVVSLEVVEHLFDPRAYAETVFDLLEPGGAAVISTPYHGYLKNLALAVSGRMDEHFTALWDGGHIKFWSEATLTQLLRGAGFTEIRFRRAGRLKCLAKSMIAVAQRPNQTSIGGAKIV